ncbi:hypothetical protein [Phaeobacter sp. B1627]|uniref:hypothetical protein n=1 Tax=Phaeobacter sp. B1627 TaxID=2583809 RepID=UPI001119F6EC|nr:hypothetical protein [Phaeobacter sp. B1627]TNJ40633.1 hypothetical protein FGE21_17145 [Phaeobacter sp. B1627]
MISVLSVLILAIQPGRADAQGAAARYNDYPTVARADYIFGCMSANGRTRRILEQCACSIDEIAGILPYEDYVSAETVLALRRGGGERLSLFRSAAVASTIVADLRRAQAEAELVCFQ